MRYVERGAGDRHPEGAGDEPSFDASNLGRECEVFARALVGTVPGGYVRAKYELAHRARPELQAVKPFDRLLLRIARLGPWWTGFCDGYARLLASHSPLRGKLVTMLAILENASPSYRVIDTVPDAPSVLFWPLLIGRIILAGLRQLLAVGLLLPVHLSLGLFTRSR